MILWVLTLLGFLLRSWKLEYGLPQFWFIDEGRYIYDALNMAKGGLNPHALQPTLFLYLALSADVVYILGRFLTGSFQSISDGWKLYKSDPTVYYVIGRGISALLGTLTLPVLYSGVKQLFGRRTAIISAFFLTFAYLHVQYSQIAYMDATLTFFMTLSFCFAAAGVRKAKNIYFGLAGLAGGLAFATKYYGIAALLFGPAASFFAQEGRPKPAEFLRKNFIFFSGFFLGFTIGNPYWLLAFNEFKGYLLVILRDYKKGGTGQLGYEGKWNWIYYLKEPLRYGLRLPLQLAGLLGMAQMIGTPDRKKLFFLSFPLAYFAFIGISDIRTARYAMPLIPFFCAAAGFAVVTLTDIVFAKLHFHERWKKAAQGSLALLLIIPSLVNVLRYNTLKGFPDTRQQAKEWIQKNLPPDPLILQTFFAFAPTAAPNTSAKYLDITVFDTRLHHRSSLKTLSEYRAEGWKYLVLDDWHTGIIMTGAKTNPYYAQTGERYESFLQAVQKGDITPLAVFSPYANPDTLLNVENVEYTSEGLWSIKRLGPQVAIYRF